MRTIAISTPTGNVGTKLISFLLDDSRKAGVQLVLLARKAEGVARWAGIGAQIQAGRLEDPEFLVRATRGVDALYWATPNSFPPEVTMREGYRKFARSAAAAILENRIRHTVHLSGFAEVDDGGGEKSLLGGLAESEKILGDAVEQLLRAHPGQDFGISHLRAGFFFENLLGQLSYMREHGRIFLPVNRRNRIPMVASEDVARRACEILLAEPPRGRVFCGALGPKDLSFGDVSAQLSAGRAARCGSPESLDSSSADRC